MNKGNKILGLLFVFAFLVAMVPYNFAEDTQTAVVDQTVVEAVQQANTDLIDTSKPIIDHYRTLLNDYTQTKAELGKLVTQYKLCVSGENYSETDATTAMTASSNPRPNRNILNRAATAINNRTSYSLGNAKNRAMYTPAVFQHGVDVGHEAYQNRVVFGSETIQADPALINSAEADYTDVSVAVDETLAEPSMSTDCTALVDKVHEKQNHLADIVDQMKTFKSENADVLAKIAEYKQAKAEGLQAVFAQDQQAGDLVADCTAPVKLVKLRETLHNRVNDFIANNTDANGNINESAAVEYKDLYSRLNALNDFLIQHKGVCDVRDKIVNNIDNGKLCPENVKFLAEIQQILVNSVDQINESTNADAIYSISQKIKNLRDQLDTTNTVCLAGGNELTKKQALKNQYQEKIQTLKSQIVGQELTVSQLATHVKDLRDELKGNVSAQTKLQILKENSDQIVSHTLAVLELKMDHVDDLLLRVQDSNLTDGEKEKLTNMLNDLSSKLNAVHDTVSAATSASDLKTALAEAKLLEYRYTLAANLVAVSKNLLALDSIVDTYFSDHPKYAEFKSAISSLQADVLHAEDKVMRGDMTKDELVAAAKDLKSKYVVIKKNIKDSTLASTTTPAVEQPTSS